MSGKLINALGTAVAGLILLAASSAQAVGLGPIELKSRIQQRLDARIELVGLKEGDLEDMLVALADEKAFKRHGLEREAIHLELTFKVVPTGDTAAYIEVRSKQSIREPSIAFVVELSLGGGRSFRSYSLLLGTR